MKQIVLILIIGLCFSCNDNRIENKQKNTVSIDIQEYKEVNQSSLQGEPESEWLTELYKDKIEYFSHYDSSYKIVVIEETFKLLNDSISYCIIEIHSEVCLEEFIVTQFNKQTKDMLKIAELCDSDLSLPFYNCINYNMLNDTIFMIKNYREYIPDSLLTLNGEIPNEQSREFFEGLVIDSTISEIKILNDGNILKRN